MNLLYTPPPVTPAKVVYTCPHCQTENTTTVDDLSYEFFEQPYEDDYTVSYKIVRDYCRQCRKEVLLYDTR
jgi:hypothetical protein